MADPDEANPLNSDSGSHVSTSRPIPPNPRQSRVTRPLRIPSTSSQQETSTSNAFTIFGSRFSPIEALSRILRATSSDDTTTTTTTASNGRRGNQPAEQANQERHQLLPQWQSRSHNGRQQLQQQQQQPRQQAQRQQAQEHVQLSDTSDSASEGQSFFHRVVDVAGSPPLSALSLGLSSAFFSSDSPAAPLRRNPGQSPLLASQPVTSTRSDTSSRSPFVSSESGASLTESSPSLGPIVSCEGRQPGEGPRVTRSHPDYRPRVTQLPPLPPPALGSASRERAEQVSASGVREGTSDGHLDRRGGAHALALEEARGVGEGERTLGNSTSSYCPYETPPRLYDAHVAISSTNGEPFNLRSLTSPPTPSQMLPVPCAVTAAGLVSSPSLLSLPESAAEGGERSGSGGAGEVRVDVDGEAGERRGEDGRGECGEVEGDVMQGLGLQDRREGSSGESSAAGGATGAAAVMAAGGATAALAAASAAVSASDAAGEVAAMAIVGRGGRAGRAGGAGGGGGAGEAAEAGSDSGGEFPTSDDGDDSDGGGRGGSGGGGGGGTVTRGSDMHLAARSLEQAVPFVFLLLFVQVRQHLIGFCTVVWLTAMLFKFNDFMRKQGALKADRNPTLLALAAVLLLAHVAVVNWLFWPEQLWRPLLLIPPSEVPPFWQALFIIVTNDILVRFLAMAVKCAILIAYRHSKGLNSRQQAQVLTLIEYTSLLYRAFVPAPVWYRFFLNDQAYGRLTASLTAGLYLTFKLSTSLDRVLLFVSAIRQAVGKGEQYGTKSTAEEVTAAGDLCAICQEHMTDPVTLRCRHVFCDECVSEWFERERTCPLCRTVVKPAGLRSFSDANTSLLVQLF